MFSTNVSKQIASGRSPGSYKPKQNKALSSDLVDQDLLKFIETLTNNQDTHIVKLKMMKRQV